MSFVLDNSVAMCWLLNDGRAADIAYSLKVLEALKATSAVVPGLWALEAANVVAKARHVLDTRNACKRVTENREKITLL